MPPPPPPPTKKPGSSDIQVFRALYNYTALHSDELTFEEGDLLYIIDKPDPQWWQAKVGDKTGLVPVNYRESAEQVENPLHDAAKRGNLPFLNELLAQKFSANALDKAGSTALHWAASGGHLECVQRLLQVENIALDAQNKIGDTPLHGAAWKGHEDVVKALLDKGANPLLKNKENKTPLMLARKPEVGALLQVIPSSRLAEYQAAVAGEEEDDD